ncbi:unnamed protein product [Moneuplotes crassus]|uniref:Uncharacterized protein n=1 Tax=Euplotes crassus TaxID=5936 RepID=A0AAD2D7F7_EUPCR|nr:unnamed protein product [Moneuplotes crassus]
MLRRLMLFINLVKSQMTRLVLYQQFFVQTSFPSCKQHIQGECLGKLCFYLIQPHYICQPSHSKIMRVCCQTLRAYS